MEVITFHVGVISRGKGRSAVQLAAYCARDRLYNAYNGRTYDYTGRSDLVFHEILLPDYAPAAFSEQQILWNNVEQTEKNRNARLARMVYFTLPKELDRDTHISMTRRYVQEYFVNYGMCADVSIHDKCDGNPHVHVLLTTRSIDETGMWMSKQRKNYLLNKDGTRIRDPRTNQYRLGASIKTNDWDKSEYIEKWREGLAKMWNTEFEYHGIDRRVTHISYARQGIERKPTRHLGAKVKALESRGIPTDRGNENREIQAGNKKRERQMLERQYGHDRSQIYERTR